MTYQRTLTENNKGPDPQIQAEHMSQVRSCTVLGGRFVRLYFSSRNRLTPERIVLNCLECLSSLTLPRSTLAFGTSRIPAANENLQIFTDFTLKSLKKAFPVPFISSCNVHQLIPHTWRCPNLPQIQTCHFLLLQLLEINWDLRRLCHQ